MATTTDARPAGVDDYVELRCKSAFSFLDGATLPEELVARARELGFRALGLVDRDGLYGAPRFFKAASRIAEEKDPASAPSGADRRDEAVLDEWVKRWPLKPILGAELSLLNCKRLTVLVESRVGYRNLSRLITAGRLGDGRNEKGSGGRKIVPAFSMATLAEHAEGLVALTGGGEGAVGSALDASDEAGAVSALDDIVDAFGAKNVYAEIGRHFDADEELRNRRLLRIARRARLPIVATNDVRYARPDDRRLHDVLTCTRERATVDEIGRRLPANGERFLKSPSEMTRLFADLPDAVRRTREVADRCSFTLAQLGYRFPTFALAANSPSAGASENAAPGSSSSMHELLTELTWKGASDRFRPMTDKAHAQLERELRLIIKLDLAGYFLIVWDLCEFCRRRGILVQGRGSAANSAVCFALGITAVDPVKMELLFERFLSEERGEWPDIDLDLPSGTQREEVIQYVYKKYGERGAAMTANVITYRPKMAVRDVGRALGFREEELARMAKLLSSWGFVDEHDGIANRIAQAGFTVEDPRTRHLVELSNRLLNLPRHLGQHSGGMVIAAGRLDEVVPLEPASMPGRVVVQWDKDDCSDLGIVKVDLLGLGMMAVLEESVELVRAHEGVEVDLAHLPPDDPAIYKMLQTADTVGLFQVESRAQMATLPRMNPTCFYDIVIEVAIIRPGPIVGDMLHPYLRRRAGRELPDPIHPSLQKVLGRTLGVPLFQEQLMKIAMIAASFTGGQAEELRRAMGFKRSVERMHDIERDLREGMSRNGITGEPADKIVKAITAFALYGFPESHAASFALLVYASAHLKAHHPAAFYAALLNNWPMGFYHPSSLVRDALLRAVEVRSIDVTRSNWLCTLESASDEKTGSASDGKSEDENESKTTRNINQEAIQDENRTKSAPVVRIGLRYVRGLSEACARRIEVERARRAFASVEDLTARVSPSRAELIALAEVGGFAGLGRTRRAALWQVESIGRSGPLFVSGASAGNAEPAESIDESLDEMTEHETLAADYRVAGLSTGRHPLALRREFLARAGVVTARDLEGIDNGRRVRIAGTVIVRQRPGTAKGFFFLTLEDETGLSNAIVTPKHFEENRPLLVSAPALVLEGKLQKLEGTTSVKADRFYALNEIGPPSHDFH